MIKLEKNGKYFTTEIQTGLICYDTKPKFNTLPPTPAALDQIPNHKELMTDDTLKILQKIKAKLSIMLQIKKGLAIPSLDERLYHHQKQGVHFINSAGNRVLIWDDARTGKTSQALVALFGKQAEPSIKPCLIVCKRANSAEWLQEFNNWNTHNITATNIAKSSNPLKLQTIQNSKHKVFIVNWQSLPYLSKYIKANHFESIIVDEAHVLKNRKSQATKAMKKLKSKNLILLTATPYEKLEEFYTYCNLLYPKQFNSYWRFVNWFCTFEDTFFGIKITGIKENTIHIFHEMISRFTIRRKLSDVIKANDIQVIVSKIETDMSVKIKEIYNDLEKLKYISSLDLELPNKMSARIKQQQLVSNPLSLGVIAPNLKLEKLLSYIKQFNRVVIFCSRIETIKMLNECIDNSVAFHGGSLTDDSEFISGKKPVLITNPQMGGEGKDYSFADRIIFYELPLPPSATRLTQCMARGVKLGVTKKAHVDFIIGSPIEHNIYMLIERKQLDIQQSELLEVIK